jgi:hypothetical protein
MLILSFVFKALGDFPPLASVKRLFKLFCRKTKGENQRGTKTVLIPKVEGARDDIGDHVYPMTSV